MRRTPAWLWAVPLLSCGLLAAVPPFVIATKKQTRQSWYWCIGFAAATFTSFVMIGSQPYEAENLWTGLGVSITLIAMIVSPIYSAMIGGQLEWRTRSASNPQQFVAPHSTPTPHQGPAPTYDPNRAAIEATQVARHKRTEALSLAKRDPQMARDLRIGRPDLPRQYEDGGLVDVNNMPTIEMAYWLGLTQAQAEKIAQARTTLGGFSHPDDLMQYAELDIDVYEQRSDRIILL